MDQQDREAYQNLIDDLMKATRDNRVDRRREVVYPLLQANLHQLDDKFLTIWRERTEAVLSWTEPAEAENIAIDIGNFSNLISDFPLGSKRTNMEISIAGYNLCLTVFTRDGNPLNWSDTQICLGNAYSDRIAGDRAENLELAIAFHQQALQVHSKKAFPTRWAMTQNNLGNAYSDRIAGDRAENLELAIVFHQQALQVHRKEAFPIDWAMTQNNLGNAYRNRIAGDRAENLELAVASYKNALQVYTKEAFPIEWAMTQHNLGNVYRNRIAGDRAENLELAVASYKNALQVYTKEAFPIEWAMTQENLAYVYRDKGQTSEAIDFFESSLTIFTPETLPLSCLKAARSLGNLHYREGNWQKAILAYETAAEAIDRVWQWAPTEERREQILTDDLQLYQNLVQSYLNIAEPAKALATVERTKSRNLLELVANLDIDPEGEFSPKLLKEFNRLRRETLAKSQQLQALALEGDKGDKGDEEKADTRQTPHTSHTPPTSTTLELKELQQQLDGLLEKINRIDPGFSLRQRVETMTAAEIGELVADGETAIIEWFVTGEKLVAFVVFQGRGNGEGGTGNAGGLQIRVKEYTPQQSREVAKRANGYYRLYRRRDNRVWWLRQLQRRMENLAQLLQMAELVALIPEKCRQLILVPHLYLHLLPLHALGDLFSRFPKGVQYAPSCQLLRVTQRRGQLQPQQPRSFFAIENPTEDLTYTELEVATVARLFQPQSKVLAKKAARKSELKGEKLGGYNHHHFSCHGFFDPNNPKLSALILADAFVTASATRSESRYLELRDGRVADIQQCLTWGEIAELDLRQTRLVVLSACETGLTKLNLSGEEYIGLPSALIIAGATNAIVTLWTVNDLATAFLTIQFYHYYLGGCSPALALNGAQIWLRQLTKGQLREWIGENQLNLSATQEIELDTILYKKEESERPFEEPYYWAGFCAIGR